MSVINLVLGKMLKGDELWGFYENKGILWKEKALIVLLICCMVCKDVFMLGKNLITYFDGNWK